MPEAGVESMTVAALDEVLCCQHSAAQRHMNPLDFWHIQHASGIADQHRAGCFQAWHGLPASFDDGAGTGRDQFRASEQFSHHRVMLELLKRLEGFEFRVAVIEPDDETDINPVHVEVINKTTAIDVAIQRPADAVQDMAFLAPALG